MSKIKEIDIELLVPSKFERLHHELNYWGKLFDKYRHINDPNHLAIRRKIFKRQSQLFKQMCAFPEAVKTMRNEATRRHQEWLRRQHVKEDEYDGDPEFPTDILKCLGYTD